MGSIEIVIAVFPPSSVDSRLFLFFFRVPYSLSLVVSDPPRVVFDGLVPDRAPKA